MKNTLCLGVCLLTFTLGAAGDMAAQQAGGGLPTGGGGAATSAAPAGQPSGLNGGMNAGANNAGALNSLAPRESTAGPDVGAPDHNAGPVQPLYQNSAAVPGGRSMMEAGQSNTSNGGMTESGPATAGNGDARGHLGVFLLDSDGAGVRVSRVTSGSAADKAGLRSGDVILQVNGRGTKSAGSAAQMIRAIPVGQTANLTIWRDGDQQQMPVVMEAAREPRRVGYRGGMGETMSGDAHDLSHTETVPGGSSDRISRLEQQLQVVTEDLQQLRQEISALRGAGGGGINAGSEGLGRAMSATGSAPSPPPGAGASTTGATGPSGSGTTGAAGATGTPAGAGAAGATSTPGAAAGGASTPPAGGAGAPAGQSNTGSTDSLFQ